MEMPDVVGLYKHFTTVSPHKTEFTLSLNPPMDSHKVWDGDCDGLYYHEWMYQEVIRQRDELQAKLDKAKWQPIETAPRYGTPVLCQVPAIRLPIILNCEKEKEGLSRPDGDPKQRYFDAWRKPDRQSYTYRPTHWMPLPNAPEQP